MTENLPSLSTEAVIRVNQDLLTSIATCSYDDYEKMCVKDLTCFEPESKGMLIEGLSFHKYYFDLAEKYPNPARKTNVTMSQPHVRWIGKDCAILSYVRVDQIFDESGSTTKTMSETRVWQVQNGVLKHVHFHKS